MSHGIARPLPSPLRRGPGEPSFPAKLGKDWVTRLLDRAGRAIRHPFRPRGGKGIPILTYHAAHADGGDYAGNDHLALEHDLALIRTCGWKVAHPDDAVAYLTGTGGSALQSGRWVVLTFDDAPDWDYFDYVHPDVGCIKSFYRILVEAGGDVDAGWPAPTGASFVIADPEARVVLDRTCLAGRGHWRDFWWYEAAQGGVLGIANHSWDHTHVTLPRIRQRDQLKGTFFGIDTEDDANGQVSAAQWYIWYRTAGLAMPYFAYPYGEASEYLAKVYFPGHADRHGLVAAFATGGDYAHPGVERWNIPRFVFGQHWRKPEELEMILRGAKRGC